MKVRRGINWAVAVWLMMLVACGGSQSDDPRSRLEQLMADRDRIEAEISRLRKELNVKTSNGNGVREIPIVRAARIQSAPFDHYVTVQGSVESDTNILVPYRSSGTIENVLVQEGDQVKKGQVLARLDSAVLERGLEELEGRLTLATTIYERTKRLWERNIGSEIDYLTAKNEKESLEKQIETQKEQIRLATVLSPIDGTVDDVMARVGEAAVSGQPAVRIVKLSDLTIRAAVSENYVSDVKAGNVVQVRFPVLNMDTDMKISAVGRVVDPNNRTFNVEINIPDGITGVLPNMTAVLVINDYSNPSALVVPLRVLQKTEARPFLFTAQKVNGNWKAVRTFVREGLYYGEQVEILEGLDEGDRLIVDGYQNLADGQTIRLKQADGD